MSSNLSLSRQLKKLEAEEPFVQLVRQECPYRIPKGFMRWEILSGLVALMLRTHVDPSYVRAGDRASATNAHRTALWFVQNAPIYCLGKELLRAFEQSDIAEQSTLLKDFKPPLYSAIVLFPCNSIVSPAGSPMDYAVLHLSDRSRPEISTGERAGIKVRHLSHDHEQNFHWSAIDAAETVWFSGVGLERDGQVITSDDQLGSNKMDSVDVQFTARVRSILLQCLLAIAYEPELIEATAQQEKTKSFQAPGQSQRSQPLLQPRWLGRTYRQASEKRGGSHASPQTHWRRGHWRRVAVGEGRRDRLWKWIKPVLVGS